MKDPEDAVGWLLVVGMALLMLAFMTGIGFWIAHQVMDSSAKDECRASGRRVMEDATGKEWWCAPATPERP